MIELNEKQKRFCDEYLIDLNGTQAAIRAGYSEKTAPEQAARLLVNVKVQEYLSIKQKAIAEKFEITHERVLMEYAKLAFFDIRKAFDESGKFLDVKDLPDEVASALAGIEVLEEYQGHGENKKLAGFTKKLRLSGRKEALDSICKMLGYNAPDKSESTIKLTTNLKELPDDELLKMVANGD